MGRKIDTVQNEGNHYGGEQYESAYPNNHKPAIDAFDAYRKPHLADVLEEPEALRCRIGTVNFLLVALLWLAILGNFGQGIKRNIKIILMRKANVKVSHLTFTIT